MSGRAGSRAGARLLGSLAMLAAVSPGQASNGERAQTIAPGAQAAVHWLDDVDGDRRADLVLALADGRVLVGRGSAGPEPLDLPDAPRLLLPHPGRCLVALADLLGLGQPQLVTASPAGVQAWSLTDGGATLLSPLASFGLRTGMPRLVEFVQDVNADGRADVVLPRIAHQRRRKDLYELWLQDVAEGKPALRLAASVPLQLDRVADAQAQALSDVLESGFSVPHLAVRDVNGDGRRDLLVAEGQSRAFHLQRPDGSLSAEPDVSVDLSIFRDTTPRAGIRPGRTLAASDAAQMQSRDLDGDGIPDYVVVHRRKVWVFHGSRAGPQLSVPSMILKTQDDVTVSIVVKLDSDAFPDLLLVKVVVPTVATLIAGMLGAWEVEIEALGYRNEDGRHFATAPQWKSALTVQLPSILSVLRDPQALLRRFESVGRKFRREVVADVDGDGNEDVLLPNEAGDQLELWRGSEPRRAGRWADETLLREVLFDDPDRVWNLDRILQLVTSQAEERVARLTGGRAADGRAVLRAEKEAELVDLLAADLDGDGRDEIVAVYEQADAGRATLLDVLRWR